MEKFSIYFSKDSGLPPFLAGFYSSLMDSGIPATCYKSDSSEGAGRVN